MNTQLGTDDIDKVVEEDKKLRWFNDTALGYTCINLKGSKIASVINKINYTMC